MGRLGDKEGEMGSFRPFSEFFSFYFERKRGQNGEDGINVDWKILTRWGTDSFEKKVVLYDFLAKRRLIEKNRSFV